ncbi:MAG TPA: sterol desaturase family protein [Gemmataceae bacterium]|nr:sterol desaturase family protein [Gemmataceae bacterium]
MTELGQAVLGFLVMGTLCSLLEKLWPEDPDQPRWRRDSLTDVAYFAMRMGISVVLVVATAITSQQIPQRSATLAGSQPLWLQMLEVLLLGDLVNYWVHRLMHRVYPLWRFHAIHHSARQVDWLVASRVHPVELVMGKLAAVVPLYLMGFAPVAFAVVMPLVATYSLFLHANLTWDYGPFRYLLASPAFHRWHHSADAAILDKNLAQVFPVFDYLFGTLHFPRGSHSDRYGLPGKPIPASIWQQLIYPLWPAQRRRASVGQPDARIVMARVAVAPAPPSGREAVLAPLAAPREAPAPALDGVAPRPGDSPWPAGDVAPRGSGWLAGGGMLKVVGAVHGRLVFSRRIRVLAQAIAALVPPGSRVLDVGCGDGTLAALVAEHVAGLAVEGYEILPRPQTAIPVHPFDGRRLPVADNSADVVLLVDVLHHTADPMVLLREAVRVARHAVVIKDHRLARPGAALTLGFMDWVGNRPHDVVLPWNYWPEQRWREAWTELGLTVEHYATDLGLYPWPASWAFETGLHFLTRLAVPGESFQPPLPRSPVECGQLV